MRLILLAVILGFVTYSEYQTTPLFFLSSAEKLYAVTALACYLLCEGMVARRKEIHRKKESSESSTCENRTLVDATLHTSRAGVTEGKTLEELDDARKKIAHLSYILEQKSSQIVAFQKAETTAVPQKVSEEALNQQAVILLGLFQSKGRLLDFLMEDIAPIDDSRVGAVARFVHEGCRKIVRDHFLIEPVHGGLEGDKIELNAPFNPKRYKLSGKVSESPPFKGKIVHRGWKSGVVKLPQPVEHASADKDLIIAPAEVECA
jgi:hypothetical protein